MPRTSSDAPADPADGPGLLVERCTVEVVRCGGWSWGPDPSALVQRVIDTVTGLIAGRLASLTETHAYSQSPVPAGGDVLIPGPVRVDVRLGMADLIAGLPGSITLILPTGREIPIGPGDLWQDGPDGHVAPDPRPEAPVAAGQLEPQVRHEPLTPVVGFLAGLSARDEATALVRLLTPAARADLIAALVSGPRPADPGESRRALALLLPALEQDGGLAPLLDLVPLEALERWQDLAVPAPAGGATKPDQQLALDVAAELAAAIARRRQPVHGEGERVPLPRAPLRPQEDHDAVGGASRQDQIPDIVLAGPAATAGPEPPSAPAMRPVHGGEPDEVELNSVLPFLLVAPLARTGVLDAVLPALAGGVRSSDEIEADTRTLAAALACTVLGPLHRGWRRGPEDRGAAAIFAELPALPDQDIAALLGSSRAGRTAATVLDAVIALTLCRGHSAGRPLLLTEVSADAGGGLLLCDEEGLFPIAWTGDPAVVVQHWRACGQPPVLIGTPLADDLLIAPDLDHWEVLAAAGARIATPLPPLHGQRLVPLPGRRAWVSPGQPVEAGTVTALTRLPGQLSRLSGLLRALAVERRAAPGQPMAGLARTVFLLAALGLGTLSWLMWKDREPADPLLMIERFADLSGVVHRDPQRVVVRIPLGRRHSDLLRAGMLTEIADVPWLSGRTLTVTGG